MPLLIKFSASNGSGIALFRLEVGEEPSEPTLLGRIELDFELTPVSLTTAEDRQRLLAALVKLREDSGVEETQAHLLIPPSWGIALRLPNPSLPEEELHEHLRWELSMALLDSVDQYQYNFAYDDDSVLLTALRSQLFDLLKQLILDAGFELQALFLDGDPWQRIDLADTAARPVKLPVSELASEESPAKEFKRPEAVSASPSGNQRRWFFTIVLLIGLVAVAVFAWMKLSTGPRIVPIKEVAVDTTKLARAVADTAVKAPLAAEEPARVIPEAIPWVAMSRRMDLVQQFLDVIEGKAQADLISFTADRFLCQISGESFNAVEEGITRIKNLPALEDLKSRQIQPQNGLSRGVACGRLKDETSRTTLNRTDSAAIIALAKKHGLKHKAMIFSGQRGAVMSFLDGIARGNYAVYRLILVPWGDREYRTVIEL